MSDRGDWLSDLAEQLKDFAAERDWDQFHTPKNLAAALAVEVAELLEVFQWLTPEQSLEVSIDPSAPVAAELADVLIYAVRLADVLGIDIKEAVRAKLAENASRYPVDRVRGSASKALRPDP